MSFVIVVFDGLQPAQVTPDLMPNLARLAADGVTCHNHHAVFPTVTRANVASIVTGHHPGAHGLTANTLVIPEFDPHRAIGALEPVLTEVAASTPVLLKPTLGDILHQHQLEYIAVGAGTTGNAYLQNPNAENFGGATIHPDFTLPRMLHQELTSRFGPWPDQRGPAAPKMARIVDIFTQYVLAERRPVVSMLWFSEPDSSQHAHGVGSAEAVASIGEADRQFGRLLDWMERNGTAADTNLIVTSDHGYSTISEVVEIEAHLRCAGFPSAGEPGGVAVAANGGSALFYATSGDPATTERLAEWLMSQPWCGPILASDAAGEIAGTLPARLVGLEGPRAPSLTMSFRWDSAANSAGFAGHAFSASLGPGRGQHGSMSRHETHNVLFARGPAFKQSTTVSSPTGNVDLAPTILHLLGLPGGESMDGRVLEEILSGGQDSVNWVSETHEASRETPGGSYLQHIALSRVDETVYVDHGSGGLQSG
jgi:arylsulfatase A-like enzyme